MLFLKLAIAAVLALTVSTTPTQTEVVTTDAALQRRATATKIFARKHYQCADCGQLQCEQIDLTCINNGCCT
ncbi:uncharacterized protein MELLADRAFT_124396 [Melampsora larici-populina 98AG31]|uniref:Secreted protein n=1 Tax=Melampsora larici-populina (strain 98AG31 / pathotype 3-4-7) TaxID=747676 RepID=F4S094_MELLP|nr:uncharacterized protein MELLADRAFT_124396 [Melampsora larici-populina 98AG31]EGG01921.1 secreted protein [Melampsora larici-populina 98AG31]